MSTRSPREIIAEGAIILALSVGAWSFFVSGRSGELEGLRGQMDETALASLVRLTSADDISAGAEALRARVSEIDGKNDFADDATSLYEAVRHCAATSGVVLQRITPSARSPKSGNTRSVRISILLQGRYHQIAEFIDELHSLPAFIRPVEMQLAPDPTGGPICTAQVQSELIQFEIPEVLKEMIQEGAAGHGTP